jgi:hypothetical protein
VTSNARFTGTDLLTIKRVLKEFPSRRSDRKMALDMEKEIARHQKGWEDFAKMTFIGTVVVIAIVGLMALTLL